MLTCKDLAAHVKQHIKAKVETLGRAPVLTIISVGDDPASKSYVKGKIRDCEEVGIDVIYNELYVGCTQEQLNEIVALSNEDSDGIIVQLPLPKHLDADKALSLMDPSKDVDGLRSDSPFTPCTARGVFEWLNYNLDLEGKHVAIINRSKLVGRPLAKLLLDANATVTVCHSKTGYLKAHTSIADIVVTAVGKAGFIDFRDVRNGAVVVDVGINRNADGKLCGDYACSKYDQECSIYATPVPGGVGLLTRAYLLQNVLDAYLANLT